MVGYGDEDNHFVVELTYNYGIKNYRKGNDFRVHFRHFSALALPPPTFLSFVFVVLQSISIYSKDVVERIKRVNYIQRKVTS